MPGKLRKHPMKINRKSAAAAQRALLGFLCVSVVMGFSPLVAAPKVIRFWKLVDGTGRVVANAVVVVDNNRIQAVGGSEIPLPPGAEVIDLSRYTGIPG